MNIKSKSETAGFLFIWIGWYLFINFSDQVNTIGVFHSSDQSLLIPSLYGAAFNALLFFGNAHFLISRYLLGNQVIKYLLIAIVSFFSIILLDSTLDYYYYLHFYDRRADYSEILIGNVIIDFFFIVIPSFLYRFGKDWFKPTAGPVAPALAEKQGIISVKSGKTVYQIPHDQLSHVESDGNYIKYHYNGKYILSRDSLANQEKILSPLDFIRCHKSFIVSRKHVTKLTYEFITLDKTDIPIGRSYREQVKDFFVHP